MHLLDLYALLIRLLLGYTFASAGLCKLTHGMFGQLIGPPTADMLPGLEGIWVFLAVSQVVVGAVVLSGRWALVGLLALLPLNVGILAYTIGNHWTGTPFVNGFLVLLNGLALLPEWPSLRFLVMPDAVPPADAPRTVRLWPGWQWPALVLLLLTATALTATLEMPVGLTALLGAAGFGAAWTHALRAPTLTRLDRIVLALPGLAVVWLSVVPAFNRESMFPAMLTGVVGGLVAVAVPTANRGWQRWRGRYSSARP